MNKKNYWKKILPIGMLVLCLTNSFAGDNGISISQNHKNGVYKVGEEIVFTVTSEQPIKVLQYKVLIDGNSKPAETGAVQIKEKTSTVKYTAEKPACIVFTVMPDKDDKKSNVSLGAVADPFKIKPSLPAPADFDEFWDKKKDALTKIPLNIRLSPVEEPVKVKYGPKVECFDIQLDSLGDKPVSGYYVKPVDAKKRSLPAILYLHSAGVRGGSLRAAWLGAKRNMISMDINAHGLLNEQSKEYYHDKLYGELKGYAEQGMDDPDKYYFLGMYMRIVRAIDFLTAQPEWDGKTVILQGSSQGGGQSLVGAGLDNRVTDVKAGVPAFCDLIGQEADRQAGWPGRGRIRNKTQLKTLGYFDACNLASRTKAKVAIIVGLLDTTCTPVGILAAYNQFPGEKSIIILPSRGHSGTKENRLQEKDETYIHENKK